MEHGVKRKDFRNFSDKIVIADASPLIDLKKIEKLNYLKMLFSEVYTTETVRKECKFKLPDWIKVEEPQETTKKMFKKKGMDDGEKSAVGLAYEIEIMQKYNIIKKNPCLILDDRRAEKVFKRWDLGFENIKLKDIFCFAYDKKLFTKEEGIKLIEELAKKGRSFKKMDINYIFNEKIKGISIGVGR